MTGGGAGRGAGRESGRDGQDGERRNASPGAQHDGSRTAGRAGARFAGNTRDARTPGDRPNPAGSWSGHAELEELPAQPVVPRGSPRLGRTGTLVVAVMLGLLAAGFGVLGGRPGPTPAPTRGAASTASGAVPSPIVAGDPSPAVTPWIACAAPPAEAPVVLLEVDGRPAPGAVEVVSLPNGTAPTGRAPATRQPTNPPRIEVPLDVITEIWIGDGACANAWTVDFVQGDVLQAVTNPGLNPAYAAQNRFEVSLAPYGGQDLILRAVLVFPTFIALATWPVHVAPLERPQGILRWRTTDVPAVEGCDVVMTLGNGWEDRGAECGDDMNQGPSGAIRVEHGASLEFELAGWEIMNAEVVCGRLSGHSFVSDSNPGCEFDPGSEGTPGTFRAPAGEGLWTLGISACAIQLRGAGSNTICGTWYANVEVR